MCRVDRGVRTGKYLSIDIFTFIFVSSYFFFSLLQRGVLGEISGIGNTKVDRCFWGLEFGDLLLESIIPGIWGSSIVVCKSVGFLYRWIGN